MRECKNVAASRAISDAATSTPDAHLSESQIKQFETIDAEAGSLREKKDHERQRMARSIELLWLEVRKEWDGGVREILRADGTGEAEEKCRFVFPWERLDFGKAVEQVVFEDVDWEILFDHAKEDIKISEKKWEIVVKWEAVESEGDRRVLEDVVDMNLKLEDEPCQLIVGCFWYNTRQILDILQKI
jgi:hypothetical protein